uniref:Uncharacterized protein n=1 Tax=Anopheles culicifacies TaxID=139723 RepID=A0A182MUG6_9DIPT
MLLLEHQAKQQKGETLLVSGAPLAVAMVAAALLPCCLSLSNSCNFERTLPSQMLFSRIWGAFGTAPVACCLRSSSKQNASYSKRCFNSACESFAFAATAATTVEVDAYVRALSLTVPFGVAVGVFGDAVAAAALATVALIAIQDGAVVPVE